MSLKEELNGIDIPRELHTRSLDGIERAKRELELSVDRPKKKRNWGPIFATVIVSAATLFFVFNALTNGFGQGKTAANTGISDALGLHIAFTIANAITLALLIGAYFVRKYRLLKLKWLVIVLIACLSITWNTAYKESQQLLYPEVLPISNNSIFYNNILFPYYYVMNIHDKRYVQSITFNNELTIQSMDGWYSANNQYNQLVFNRIGESSHHELRSVNLIIENEDLEQLRRAKITGIFVTFSDGSTRPVKIEEIHFQDDSNFVKFTFLQGSSSNSGMNTAKTKLDEDFYAKGLIIPNVLKGKSVMTIRVNDEVIFSNDPTAPINGLPTQLAAGDIVLSEIHVQDMSSMYYGNINLINETDEFPVISLYIMPSMEDLDMQAILDKQRGEQNDRK